MKTLILLACAWVLWHFQTTVDETTGAADPSVNRKRETSGEFIQDGYATLADCNSAKTRVARSWIGTMSSAGWDSRQTSAGMLIAQKERRWGEAPREPAKDAMDAQIQDALDRRHAGSVMTELVYVQAKCLPDTIDPRGPKR